MPTTIQTLLGIILLYATIKDLATHKLRDIIPITILVIATAKQLLAPSGNLPYAILTLAATFFIGKILEKAGFWGGADTLLLATTSFLFYPFVKFYLITFVAVYIFYSSIARWFTSSEKMAVAPVFFITYIIMINSPTTIIKYVLASVLYIL